MNHGTATRGDFNSRRDILGVPDPRLGERVCAFVVTDDGEPLALADLRSFLEHAMVTKTSWPEALVHVPELPVGVGGKIGKATLRASAEQLRATGVLDYTLADRTGAQG